MLLLLLLLSSSPCWAAATSAHKQPRIAHKQPRIAILTLSPGVLAQPYMAQTVVNKAKYANRHDYGFHLFDQLDITRIYYWSKILALKKVIKGREYDWVMWLDGSVVITNYRTKIESMLPGNLTIDFVVTRDCNTFTLGAFLMRTSKSSLEVLEQIYDGPHLNKTIIEHPELDSRSFQILFSQSEQLRAKTAVVPQKTFNSYTAEEAGKCGVAAWSQADFAIHLSGGTDEMREKLVPEYLRKVIV